MRTDDEQTADPRLHEYYESRYVEAERLDRRSGRLELERTKELLGRHLPPKARIIDIGGGTGIYAAWLASLGHHVHLIDVVAGHVETAAASGAFTTAVGDARSLPDADDTYDVALLMGPLYHLPDSSDRQRALAEARRVLRPGGLLVAAYVSRPATMLDGYVKGWIYSERGLEAVRNIVGLGVDDGGEGFGAIAYFHQPSEVAPELEAVDFTVEHVYGIEGPGWIAPDFDERWSSDRDVMLETARACESDPELLGVSGHIMAVARRP